MKSVDYLIVGSGLTGGVIARMLSDVGREVLIVESRNHFGGNVYDYKHPSGVRVHAYGPHYFRCKSDEIWSFVNRFSEFYDYEARIKTLVDNKIEDWPINRSYTQRLNTEDFIPHFEGTPNNFEETCLSKMPLSLYKKFIKGYTEKQWGVNPRSLSKELANRFQIRRNYENRLTPKHKYQALPKKGYKFLIENLLKDIPKRLNYKYKFNSPNIHFRKKLIYTGPIDEFFRYKFGRLRYRGQIRDTIHLPHTLYFQQFAQINNPSLKNGSFIRTIEWKHLRSDKNSTSVKGTVITKEYPFNPINPNNYEYPFPDIINSNLYKHYRKLANELKDVIICGRLGQYRYFDMNQAIERAMVIANEILMDPH